MPVVKDARRVSGHDLEDEDANERPQQAERLLAGSDGAGATVMERANGERRRGRRREGELLLDDVVFAQGDDEEYAKEAGADRERDELACILARRVEQAKRVHSWHGGDEEDTDTACGGRGGLDGAVLLWPKITAENLAHKARLRHNAGERLEDGIAEDRTEELRAECKLHTTTVSSMP